MQKGFEFVAVEDMIYFEDYYIDNTGKQIYEPVSQTITPVVLYADDPYANVAFEKMRLYLTLDEIYNLSTFGELKLEVLEKNLTFLSGAEVAALYEMSYEELYAAYIALVYAAEKYGTADYTPESTTTVETTAAPVETTTTLTTTSQSFTNVPATTLGDKTDVATNTGDKTEVITGWDKTEIVTSQSNGGNAGNSFDKTEAVTSYYDKTEPVITAEPPVSSDTETTTVASTDTTTPPEITTTVTTSERVDVQGEEIIVTSADPK